MRTKNKKKFPQADAILTADWHLRESQPECRLDNFWETQWNSMDWLKELQQEHDCPVIVAGDVYHHWKPSPYLLNVTMEHLPQDVLAVAGQHDLPQHNLELIGKAGLSVLERAGFVVLLDPSFHVECKFMISGFNFGEDCEGVSKKEDPLIAVRHIMTYQDKKPFPGCTADKATQLLRKMKGYDLVVTGDNHESFVVEDKGRLLVNPGSFTRQTAKQIDHKPCVYLWYASTNSIEPVYIPVDKEAVSREHIEAKEDVDKRIAAFVTRLHSDWEVGLSFTDNLKAFFSKNKVPKSIQTLIWEASEE